MSPSDLQTFTREALCGQKMAALAVEAGEKLSLQTVVQLGAEIETIYILASLESRGLDLIAQHKELWQRTSDFFAAAVSIWASIEADGELLGVHRSELQRLAQMAIDRVEFYTFAESERRHHRLD